MFLVSPTLILCAYFLARSCNLTCFESDIMIMAIRVLVF